MNSALGEERNGLPGGNGYPGVLPLVLRVDQEIGGRLFAQSQRSPSHVDQARIAETDRVSATGDDPNEQGPHDQNGSEQQRFESRDLWKSSRPLVIGENGGNESADYEEDGGDLQNDNWELEVVDNQAEDLIGKP